MREIAFIILLLATISPTMQAQSPPPGTNKVITIHTFDVLYRYRNFYISTQPEVTRLTWLKDQGIKTIIDLRSEEEKEAFKKAEFDEQFVAEKLRFNYIHLPIDVSTGFTPENQVAFNQLIDPGTPTMIHCSSGRRATYLFIAYLVQEQGISLREAVDIGKQMKYTSPLEELLGKEIMMEITAE